MIDTHSHIYDEAYNGEFDAVVERARVAGVKKMVLPGIDSSCHRQMMDAAAQLPGYAFATIGLHPTSVGKGYEKELQFVYDNFSREFCAIGEIGLDEYWSKDFLQEQMKVFEDQLVFAHEQDLPVIIHSREATEDIFTCIKRVNRPLRGVFHAFSGSFETYQRIKKAGDFHIGLGGVLTYKNSHVASYLKSVPLSDILLETDAPWLTPVPFRGKRNESSYITYVAEKIASIKEISVEEVDAVTTKNAEILFKI
ncbi:MAG: TatD family hydrolase [Bacteroidales bacterium]|nr:TatD family hydrolase [Bacteroidales bacterium]